MENFVLCKFVWPPKPQRLPGILAAVFVCNCNLKRSQITNLCAVNYFYSADPQDWHRSTLTPVTKQSFQCRSEKKSFCEASVSAKAAAGPLPLCLSLKGLPRHRNMTKQMSKMHMGNWISAKSLFQNGKTIFVPDVEFQDLFYGAPSTAAASALLTSLHRISGNCSRQPLWLLIYVCFPYQSNTLFSKENKLTEQYKWGNEIC